MVNYNKKPEIQWMHHLFNQQKGKKPIVQSKAYFAHRYHASDITPKHAPFSALFFGQDNHQYNHHLEPTNSHKVLLQESLVTAENQGINKSNGLFDLDKLKAVDNSPISTSLTTINSPLTVLNCYNETLDTKTFRLANHLINSPGQAVSYLPGQYVTLSVQIGGREYKRSYSLASSPSQHGILEITAKRDPKGGVVSNWLNDNLQVGDVINVKGPYGKFSCALETPSKMLFLAAGSGIVPIMSMLRWLTQTETDIDVVLILSFRNRYDIIYADELNLIAARHKNIKLMFTLTNEPYEITQWTGLKGRINQNMIAEIVPDLLERSVYLCGPDGFMEDCKYYLQKLKHPKERLFCESFTVNSSVGTAQTNDNHHLPYYQPTLIPLMREKTGDYQICFAKSGKTIVADGTATLLLLAEQSGIHIDNECRAGNCGECMVKCVEGHIDMTEQAEIDDLDRNKGWVYACCAYPTSNVVLDI